MQVYRFQVIDAIFTLLLSLTIYAVVYPFLNAQINVLIAGGADSSLVTLARLIPFVMLYAMIRAFLVFAYPQPQRG